MKIYIIEDDVSVISVLEDIVEENNLGIICGDADGEPADVQAILAIDPDLVDRAAISDMELKPVSDELPASGFSTVKFEGVDIPVPRRVTDVTDNGWIGPDHPALATEQWGQEMLQAAADFTARFVKAFEKAPLK